MYVHVIANVQQYAVLHAMLLEAIAARGLIFSMLAFPIMRDIADEARVCASGSAAAAAELVPCPWLKAVNKRIVCLLSLITDTFGSLCELPDEPRAAKRRRAERVETAEAGPGAGAA